MTLPFEPPALRQVSPTEVEWRGRRLVYFGGSDYFRFAWHPRLRAAVARAAVVLGHNLSASRLTTGNHPLYIELERSLANFFIAPAVVLTPTGYSAPLVVGQALARRITHAFVDEQAHGCMKDAAVLSRAKVKFFRHGDAGALEESVRRCDARAKVAVFANGLSAHEGTVAPLAEYLGVLPNDGLLIVDDAHGFGTLGKNGRGALEFLGLRDRRIILTITLSKALGCYGGAVIGPGWLRTAVLTQSSLYAGGSPLPLPFVVAAQAALKLLRERGPALRKQLHANVRFVRDAIAAPSPGWLARPGPMFTIAPKSPATRETLRRSLRRAGIYPPLIRYEGGPADCFFRFAISTAHTPAQLATLRRVLAGSCER